MNSSKIYTTSIDELPFTYCAARLPVIEYLISNANEQHSRLGSRTIFKPRYHGPLEEQDCYACTEPLLDQPTIKVMACRHHLCAECFDSLVESGFMHCPECKSPIFTPWQTRGAEFERELAGYFDATSDPVDVDSMLVPPTAREACKSLTNALYRTSAVVLSLAIEAPTTIARSALISCYAKAEIDNDRLLRRWRAGLCTSEDVCEYTANIVTRFLNLVSVSRDALPQTASYNLEMEEAKAWIAQAECDAGSIDVREYLEEEADAFAQNLVSRAQQLCMKVEEWEDIE